MAKSKCKYGEEAMISLHPNSIKTTRDTPKMIRDTEISTPLFSLVPK